MFCFCFSSLVHCSSLSFHLIVLSPFLAVFLTVNEQTAKYTQSISVQASSLCVACISPVLECELLCYHK
jgi:hypothetical protein